MDAASFRALKFEGSARSSGQVKQGNFWRAAAERQTDGPGFETIGSVQGADGMPGVELPVGPGLDSQIL
jgi:hypothetical protein